MRRCRLLSVAAVAGLLTVTATACGPGDHPDPGHPDRDRAGVLRVLMVGNPQMRDLQQLTAEHFTRRTGIEVQYTVLPENEVRGRITQEFTSQAGHYDVASLSNFEVPFYAKYGWLAPLDAVAAAPAFDQADILGPIAEGLTGEDGRVYAEPFYGESSFLMYRTDVLAAAGVSMPAHPTWPQVAQIAAQVDHAQPGMRGICLRGMPGWGEMAAPLTTVVNTFGGTWFTADWQAQLDSQPFHDAAAFYVDLVREHGEPNAASAGFSECLNRMRTGGTAMWYDATSAAGLLESADSPVAGRLGFVPAPVVHTPSSGWIYSWAWGVEKGSPRQRQAAEFVSWASSRQYEELVGARLGWARVPAGKRASTYQRPEYASGSARAFAEATLTAIATADPRDPGVQPRPTVGVQFVDVPEFTALGTLVSTELSAAIDGRQSVEQALATAQPLAAQVAARYQGRRSGG